MKKAIKYGLVTMVTVIMCFASGNKVMAQPGASVNYQTFYDDLSPYGTWLDYPAYGHVWHPEVAGDFRPYLTNGYWDYAAEGWMWMSNYNWGWAPFHYGRWIYDDMYGWLWIPGYEWSPAWVTWGTIDNYYGWAPLMPGINVGIAYGSWRPASFYWNIVGRDHIYDRDIYNRVEKRDFVTNAVNRISMINNFGTTGLHNQYYSKGPDVREVERFTNRSIPAASIREVNNAAVARHQGNEIQVYRPAVANPQPRQFRRVDIENTNPVRNEGDRVNTEHTQQSQNINRLPMRTAPQSSFNTRGNTGNGGQRGHRG